jgi:hypothetical protein
LSPDYHSELSEDKSTLESKETELQGNSSDVSARDLKLNSIDSFANFLCGQVTFDYFTNFLSEHVELQRRIKVWFHESTVLFLPRKKGEAKVLE